MDERLKEIQELEGYGGLGGYAVYFKNKQQFEWLKQQAEKAWGAEHLLAGIWEQRNDFGETIKVLEKENKRYKEALEFYADRENHEPTLIHEAEYENGILVSPPDVEPPVIYFDKGERARKELEGDSKWKSIKS